MSNNNSNVNSISTVNGRKDRVVTGNQPINHNNHNNHNNTNTTSKNTNTTSKTNQLTNLYTISLANRK
jgi:hypothetical protein